MPTTSDTKKADADLNEDVSLLKEDLAALRKDLQSIFGDLKGYAGAQAKEGVEKGKVFAKEAGEQFESSRADIQEHIREKPLAAVGIAFGVGVLIAMLGRK